MATFGGSSGRGGAWILGVAAAALAVVSLGGCVKNAATGKSIFTLTSREDDIKMGLDASPQFTQEYGGKVPSADACAYVTEIGQKLAAQTEADNPTLPWEFTFLNSEVVNAFALPGGKVFFTRGLAAKLSSEAEVAGVIGHEIGHVTARHGAQQIAKQTAFQGGIAVAAVLVDSSGNQRVKQAAAVGIPALSVGGQVVMLKYGRDQELEADRLGMRYMARVNYDPAAQGNVMRVLQSLGASTTPEILSTHPYPEARIAQVEKLLASEYAGTQNNSQYVTKPEEYRRRMLSKLALLPLAPDAGGVWVAGLGPQVWCAHCREEAVMEGRVESIVAHPVLVGMAW